MNHLDSELLKREGEVAWAVRFLPRAVTRTLEGRVTKAWLSRAFGRLRSYNNSEGLNRYSV